MAAVNALGLAATAGLLLVTSGFIVKSTSSANMSCSLSNDSTSGKSLSGGCAATFAGSSDVVSSEDGEGERDGGGGGGGSPPGVMISIGQNASVS